MRSIVCHAAQGLRLQTQPFKVQIAFDQALA